jgi:disulfide bond formation protein DsbB
MPVTAHCPVRQAAALSLAAGAGVVFAALALEALGAVPCHLCLRQRWVHYLALAAIVAALPNPVPPQARRLLLSAAALAYAVSAAMALHHVLVEAGVVAAPSSCAASGLPEAGSVADFYAGLRGVRVVPCDRVGFRLLGLSLAWWNLAASPLLSLCCLSWASAPGRGVLARILGRP